MSRAPKRLKQRPSNGHNGLQHTRREMSRDGSMPICHCIDAACDKLDNIYCSIYIYITQAGEAGGIIRG